MFPSTQQLDTKTRVKLAPRWQRAASRATRNLSISSPVWLAAGHAKHQRLKSPEGQQMVAGGCAPCVVYREEHLSHVLRGLLYGNVAFSRPPDLRPTRRTCAPLSERTHGPYLAAWVPRPRVPRPYSLSPPLLRFFNLLRQPTFKNVWQRCNVAQYSVNLGLLLLP